MLTLILILAQLQISHFKRLPMPQGREWVAQRKQSVIYNGDFTMPKSGQWTLDYQKFYPADYASKTFPVRVQFCDTKECTGNQIPIYDVDESYDHITVKAKPGSHWWYSCTIAVPREDKKP